MKKIAVFLADGFEEIEALTPIDVLRRANFIAHGISIKEKVVKGSHGISVIADLLLDEIDFSSYDAFVLPGGMPGAVNLSNSKKLIENIRAQKDKLICSICASPAIVLAQNDLYDDGVFATCYPSEDFTLLLGDRYKKEKVVVSKNFITADGIKSAMDFSIAIVEKLGGNAKF